MASNSVQSLITDGYAVPSANNYFASMWCDKRSATNCSISLTLTGSGTPDGYVHVEVSNAPENYNVTYGSGPFVLSGQTSPPDTITYPGSTTLITATGTTHFDVVTASRWVRLVYVPVASSANLNAYVFCSVPFESP